jgi:hypothetical protein
MYILSICRADARSRGPIGGFMDVYATALEAIAYIQLIPSICRANACSRSDPVFTQARGLRFHRVSKLIICSVYADSMQRQVATPGSHGKRRVCSMFSRCPAYANHVQRGRTPPPDEDDAPPSPSHCKSNSSTCGAYAKHTPGPKKRAPPRKKRACKSSIILAYTELTPSSCSRRTIFGLYRQRKLG